MQVDTFYNRIQEGLTYCQQTCGELTGPNTGLYCIDFADLDENQQELFKQLFENFLSFKNYRHSDDLIVNFDPKNPSMRVNKALVQCLVDTPPALVKCQGLLDDMVIYQLNLKANGTHLECLYSPDGTVAYSDRFALHLSNKYLKQVESRVHFKPVSNATVLFNKGSFIASIILSIAFGILAIRKFNAKDPRPKTPENPFYIKSQYKNNPPKIIVGNQAIKLANNKNILIYTKQEEFDEARLIYDNNQFLKVYCDQEEAPPPPKRLFPLSPHHQGMLFTAITMACLAAACYFTTVIKNTYSHPLGNAYFG